MPKQKRSADDLTPMQLYAVIERVRSICEAKKYLRPTTISYLYIAMGQLEKVQELMDRADEEAAKANRKQEAEVTVVTVPTVEEETKPLRSEADEILKRLLQP